MAYGHSSGLQPQEAPVKIAEKRKLLFLFSHPTSPCVAGPCRAFCVDCRHPNKGQEAGSPCRVSHDDCRHPRQAALGRQDMSCLYLAHHELERALVTITIIIIIVIISIIIVIIIIILLLLFLL